MHRAALFFPLTALFCSAALPACSGTADEPDHGSVELALAEVPDDARCLLVTFAGARPASRKLDLHPGRPESFVLDRLPVGLANLDARAFSQQCGHLASTTAASYVLESPVTVRIKTTEVTRVALSLVHNGRLGVDVSFEEPIVGDLEPIQLALIGDTPYGAPHVAAFPSLVEHINSSNPHLVVHVGDIKNGSTRCDTEYFERIYAYFQNFTSPLVYTPGDNEWTDCHRANNGSYDPHERLSVLRSMFYPEPGTTLAVPKTLLSQATVPAHSTFVENQMWFESGIAFSTLHVVGSSNGYATWFTPPPQGKADDPDRRIAEVEARVAAALDWVERSFDLAETENAKGVVVFMQADTFLGSSSGFLEIIQLLAERARAFEKPVLLVQGDSHRYLVDLPFATGNAAYDVAEPVPNLTRIVIEGETIGEWLKLTIDPSSASPFSWEPMTVPG